MFRIRNEMRDRLICERVREIAHALFMRPPDGESASQAVDQWAYFDAVESGFSRRGEATYNLFVESFSGTFRAECLNQNWFLSAAYAGSRIEASRVGPDGRLGDNDARRLML